MLQNTFGVGRLRFEFKGSSLNEMVIIFIALPMPVFTRMISWVLIVSDAVFKCFTHVINLGRCVV